jgi:hypothetical protein
MSEAWSDETIRDLVRDLESLRGGAFASAALVGCGARAIEPLRTFLLQGKPRGIFQPRQLAVETLAALGAREVLIEYLRQARTITDPVIRFSEAAVESTAARALSRCRTEETYQTLKQLARTRLLPGLVEALGEFGRVEMIPYFLWALGDDGCHDAAEQALRQLGEAARPALLETANKPNPSADEEVPSSRIRRRKVLRLLAEGEVSTEEWWQLRVLLEDSDLEIAVTCARIALKHGFPEDQREAICRLVSCLQGANWFLRTEARSCLMEHYSVAEEEVESEILRRCRLSAKDQGADLVLRLLVNLKEQCKERFRHSLKPDDHDRHKKA